MSKKVCPKCGALSDNAKFINQFCAACYAAMNRPNKLPKQIVVYKCRECGAEKYKRWGDDVKESIERSLYDKRFGVPRIRMEEKSVVVSFAGIDEEFSIPLSIKDSLCNVCMQRHSGYYEGIIQLRGKYGRDKKFVDALVSKLEKYTFVQRVEQLKEGIDIYYGNREITRSLLSSMKLKVKKVSNKLWGIKKGKKVYRTTFLIRD